MCNVRSPAPTSLHAMWLTLPARALLGTNPAGTLPVVDLRLDSFVYKQQPTLSRSSYSHVDNDGVKALVDGICQRWCTMNTGWLPGAAAGARVPARRPRQHCWQEAQCPKCPRRGRQSSSGQPSHQHTQRACAKCHECSVYLPSSPPHTHKLHVLDEGRARQGGWVLARPAHFAGTHAHADIGPPHGPSRHVSRCRNVAIEAVAVRRHGAHARRRQRAAAAAHPHGA